MSYQEFLSKVANYGNFVKSDIADLQEEWKNLVSLQENFKNPIETIYDCYPYLLKSLFPNVKEDQIQQLSVAGRLFGQSIILLDNFLDKNITNKDTRNLFSPLVMQWESQKLLNRLFESDTIFWKRFDVFYEEHIQACANEENFRNGSRKWTEYTEEIGLNIVIGKKGISRAVIAGLVELSGKEELNEPLTEAVNNFNIACQVLDDLVDWKEDLKNSAPSILLARVFKTQPKMNEHIIEDVAKLIYYKGHAQHVLTIGLEAAEKALNLLQLFDGDKTDWYEIVSATKLKIESLIADLDSIVQKNLKRVKSQPKIDLQLPTPSDNYEYLSSQALNFLIDQWRKGFGEARHIVNLAKIDKFLTKDSSQFHYGDVFQRSLILGTLCDVQNKMNVDLELLIDYEIDYLLKKRRKDKIGGWAYFPDILEIAADADNLGQILQSFVLADHKELALTYCEKPIKTIINNNLLENGSIETWIIPKENRDEFQEIQYRHNLSEWGVGPDTEITANFFYGLTLYDPKRFEKLIKNAITFLESVQNIDGSWESNWYYGAFYGTYICTKLIAQVNPDSLALKYAKRFLIESQNSDGGWGSKTSDQLNTSLALISLANCDPANVEKADLAINFLQNSISNGWESVDFIKPFLGKSYKSQTITAQFICNAATTWKNLQLRKS